MSKKKTAPSSNPVSDDPFGGQSHPVAVEGERAFQVVDASVMTLSRGFMEVFHHNCNAGRVG